MRGIILAGGSGSRLGLSTKVINKHLLHIYDRPMIMYPIETLKSLGCTHICVIVGGNNVGDFIDFLGDGEEFGVKFTYKYQSRPAGIAHAIGLAEDFSRGEPVVVILGDNIFGKVRRIEFEDGCKIFVKEVSNPNRFGVWDPEQNVIIEKPGPEDTKSNLAVTGLYVYDTDVFGKIKTLTPSSRNELEVTDLNNLYLEEERLAIVNVDSFWSDAGTPKSLNRCSNYFLLIDQ